MTEITTLESLLETQCALIAQAHSLGVKVSDDLIIDIDDVAVGEQVCAKLEKLVGAPASDVAEVASQGHTAQANKPKRAKPSPKKPAATNSAAKPPSSKEKTMTTTTATKKPAKPKKSKKPPASKKPAGESKTAQVVALMKRAKGVTREEVLELTGWKAVSMQQLAKAAGVKIKIVADERPFHYKVAA